MPARIFAWLRLGLAVFAGIAVGVGGYTFLYARGYSYLTNDPSACANCHVMNAQYAGWQASSHNAVATCNDCHTPHSSLAAKYYVKAENGFRHSLAFTTGRFHEPIAITPADRRVAEEACRYCHEPMVGAIDAHGRGEPLACTRCHPDVGHP